MISRVAHAGTRILGGRTLCSYLSGMYEHHNVIDTRALRHTLFTYILCRRDVT